MAERRTSRRHKSFLRGVIHFDKSRGGTNCLIRDLSDTGARIVLSPAVTIPNTVELQIPQRGQTFRAQVQWRRADEIGLAFSDPRAETARRESGLLERIAELEAEITTLRRTIKRLKREAADDVEAA
jgi:PilZ domain-containing protein